MLAAETPPEEQIQFPRPQGAESHSAGSGTFTTASKFRSYQVTAPAAHIFQNSH